MSTFQPGLIALLGSGETVPSSGAVYERLLRGAGAPVRIAVLETPAGFQPNSPRVAGRVAEFLGLRLQNYRPAIEIVPARKRGSAFSPDDPAVSEPLRGADLLFLGPGSPTYTVSQLQGSLAWQRLTARHRRGAALATASAATIALGALALPVYEIYKVGAELHWAAGLDFFGPYGLALALLPHWNNSEGGADLDTSRCFMGQERYQRLLELLPAHVTVVGIDEHTALVLDLAQGCCLVQGRGGVTLVRGGAERRFERGERFAVQELGPFRWPAPDEGLDPRVWDEPAPAAPQPAAPDVPEAVCALLERRQRARAQRDWAAADRLRADLAALGWSVRDTPAGPVLETIQP